nr:hypothetical protein Iba_chr08dCG11340 [Ipomoea batatas]
MLVRRRRTEGKSPMPTAEPTSSVGGACCRSSPPSSIVATATPCQRQIPKAITVNSGGCRSRLPSGEEKRGGWCRRHAPLAPSPENRGEMHGAAVDEEKKQGRRRGASSSHATAQHRCCITEKRRPPRPPASSITAARNGSHQRRMRVHHPIPPWERLGTTAKGLERERVCGWGEIRSLFVLLERLGVCGWGQGKVRDYCKRFGKGKDLWMGWDPQFVCVVGEFVGLWMGAESQQQQRETSAVSSSGDVDDVDSPSSAATLFSLVFTIQRECGGRSSTTKKGSSWTSLSRLATLAIGKGATLASLVDGRVVGSGYGGFSSPSSDKAFGMKNPS